MSTDAALTLENIRISEDTDTLREHLFGLIGPERTAEVLGVERDALEKRRILIEGLREAGMNGDAENAASLIEMNIAELRKKDEFLTGASAEEMVLRGEGSTLISPGEQPTEEEKVRSAAELTKALDERSISLPPESQSSIVRSARWVWEHLIPNKRTIALGMIGIALAGVACYFYLPAGLSRVAAIEKIAAIVPYEKIKALIQTLFSLSPTTEVIPAGVGMASPSVGAV